MKEADIVAKIEAKIQEKLPGAVILKHNDFSSTGIPDLSISYRVRTTWVEVKLLKEKETPSSLKRHFSKLQLATLLLLDRQVPAYYLVAHLGYDGKLCDAGIFSPKAIDTFLKGQNLDIGNLLNAAFYLGYFNPVIDWLVEVLEKD